jgi:DEAD/DEAH box helicase domain-containing protein
VPVSEQKSFDKTVQLLGNLARYGRARFLAFGDSRKAVERLVAAVLRDSGPAEAEEDPEESAEQPWPKLEQVLPFRAGYEADDRKAIQDALTRGDLAGVVSTSALELGLDIGELDVVLLLNTPPTSKAFWQRTGRAGRRRPAVCILLDYTGFLAPLTTYIQRQPEPSWLYLENRYIQYANALCAASELQARGIGAAPQALCQGLPERFRRFVENELHPTEAVPQDLYALKQQAQSNPHYEFPIRSAAEQNFEVEGPFGLKLGNLSYAQALREAYPGAVYYYMARPFRVTSLEFKKGLIRAKRSRYLTTKPIADNTAFPDFKTGVLGLWRNSHGFLSEVELQVSERVRGFVEQRGQKKEPHEYGPASEYSQKPLNRFFQTTGVCWAFPEAVKSELVGQRILEAFCFRCGVLERDLGIASFHANEGPSGPTPVQGIAIFDATNGSLRLTDRLAAEFSDVLALAIDQADDPPVRDALRKLQQLTRGLTADVTSSAAEPTATEGDWIRVIAEKQPAMYLHSDGPIEVTVLDHRYTPHGVMYELEPIKKPGFHVEGNEILHTAAMKWMVLASLVQPKHGVTRFVRVNLITGEQEAADAAAAG